GRTVGMGRALPRPGRPQGLRRDDRRRGGLPGLRERSRARLARPSSPGDVATSHGPDPPGSTTTTHPAQSTDGRNHTMPNNAPHNALRYHVSGALARGEAVPIGNVDPVKRGPSPLSSVPRRPLTPRVVAALALASRWNTLRPGSVLIPETPASARAAYVRSRERGETVERAPHRAPAEMAAHAVLGYAYRDTTSDAIDAYDVDPRELARVTSDPRYATLAGERRDAATGELILSPIVLPDGATARVYVYDDPDADVSGEAYDDGP